MYVLSIPDEWTSDQLSEIGVDFEYSNLSERALCRVVLGPSRINVCSGLLHRLKTVMYFSDSYDYTPYVIAPIDEADRTKTGPSKEELDLLMHETPVRVYQLTAINPSFYVYSADHPSSIPLRSLHLRPLLSGKALPLDQLPGVCVKMECLDTQYSHPMYPHRLVLAAANMKDPPAQLTQKCHAIFSTKIMQMSSHLFYGEQSTTILQPSSLQVGMKSIQLPDLWKDKYLLKKDYHFELSILKSKLTRPQSLVLMHILDSQSAKKPTPLKIADTSLLEDALTKRMSSFVLHITGVKAQLAQTDKIQTVLVNIENIAVNLFIVSKENVMETHMLPILSRANVDSKAPRSPLKNSPGRAHTRVDGGGLLVHLLAQFPRNQKEQGFPSLLTGVVSQLDLNIDPKIVEWYLYLPVMKSFATVSTKQPPNPKTSQVDPSLSVTQISDTAQVKSSTPSDSQKPRRVKSSSIQLKENKSGTSEKATVVPASGKKRFNKQTSAEKSLWQTFIQQWFPTLNSMLIQIKMDGHQIFVPLQSLSSVSGRTVGESVSNSASQTKMIPLLAIAIPSLTLDNVAHKPVIQQFLTNFPIVMPEGVWNMERDNLPWTLKLADFSVFSHHAVKGKQVLLDQVSTNCTLGLTLKKPTEAVEDQSTSLALCIHTDMTPIRVQINEEQLCLLIALAEEAFAAFAKLNPNLLLRQSSSLSRESSLGPKSPLSSPEGSSTGISIARPNFLDAPVISETDTSVPAQDPPKQEKVISIDSETGLSLWIQWTVQSITFSVVTRKDSTNELLKIQLDMEDCQSSFDWAPVYFKMQSRVLSANIGCSLKGPRDNEWRTSNNRGIVLSCTDDISHELHFVNPQSSNDIEMLPHSRRIESDTSVFNFTFTRAESSNARKKWKEFMKRMGTSTVTLDDSDDVPRYVSEIDLKLAPFDVVISPPEIIPFVKMLSYVFAIKIPRSILTGPAKQPGRKSGMLGMGINNNTLPLVYVTAKTVRIFMLSSDEARDESHLALSPDFMLLQLDQCDVTPQVENPLSRIVVRPDLYNLATPLLGLPGSLIEDRQYGINFQGIGIFTGRWADVLKKSERPPKPVLKTMGENPALEWNTTKELTDQQLALEVLLLPFLSKFDLQVTLAPAIVLQRAKVGTVSSKLIAGHAAEVNATQDIAFYSSLCQIKLLSLLTKEGFESLQFVMEKLGSSQVTGLDSGVDCEASSQSLTAQETVKDQGTKVKFVPFELLVTGRKISVTVFKLLEEERAATKRDRVMWRTYRYKHRRREIQEERTKTSHAGTEESEDGGGSGMDKYRTKLKEGRAKSEDFGYEASEEGSIEEAHETIKIFPLTYFAMEQPHVFVSCAKSKQKLDLSFYDASLSLSPPEYFITCGGRRLPEPMDFPTKWFNTRPGDADPKMGIPPALFTASITGLIDGPVFISVLIDRPLKFEMGQELLGQISEHLTEIGKAGDIEGLMKIMTTDTKELPKEARTIQALVASLRRTFGSISSISLKTQQIVVHCPMHALESLGAIDFFGNVMGIQCKATFQSKINEGKAEVTSVKTELNMEKALIRLGVNGIVQTLVAPWTFKLQSESYWLPQCVLPSTNFKFCSEALTCKLGANHVLAIKALMTEKNATSKAEHEKKKEEFGDDSNMPKKKLTFNDDIKFEQNYVDDLRAGAFQYVTKSKKQQDPQPYQVIFNSNPSTMTWRYPLPRALTRVSIFPVPFMSASESASSKAPEMDETVSCALQYWDACLQIFQTYAEFTLSETNVSHLNLPVIGDHRRCAVSSTWRVLLYYDANHEEDGFSKMDREIIVTPKSLVSVMRVDSYYNSDLIPKVQASLSFPFVNLELYNHLHFHGRKLPKGLKQYSMNTNLPMEQLFAKVTLDSTLIGLDLWVFANRLNEFRAHLRMKTQLNVRLCDYAFLAFHHLVLPTKVQTSVVVNNKRKEQCVDIHTHCRPIHLKYGHFANHTLAQSALLWSTILNQKDMSLITDSSFMKDQTIQPFAHYIICNNTQEQIRFGQVDTDEVHLLKSMESHLYAWRSPKARLLLRTCVEGGFWTWCEPYQLTTESGPAVREIDMNTHKISLIITTKKLSPTQLQVVINGRLTLASMLKDHLELRVLHKNRNQGVAESVPEQRSVLGSFSTAPSFIGHNDKTLGVKVRLLGIGTPWSGEIPLQIDNGKKKSVLVRIPTKEKGLCLTIWCRLVEEKITPNFSRHLIIFSPMYMAKSLLPNPMTVVLSTPKARPSEVPVHVSLPGCDIPVQLETLGTSDQKYNVAFKVVDELPPSDPIPMSWGVIEQVKNKEKYEITESIEVILESITKLNPWIDEKMKLNGEDEKQWPFIPSPDFPKDMCWAVNDQPKTDVQVNYTQFHPLCNTLCLEINPWSLLVNQSGIQLLLKSSENESAFSIAHDSVFVPPRLEDTFFPWHKI